MIFTRNIWQMIKDLVLNDVLITNAAGAPTDGTSGTGVGLCGIGSLHIDKTNGVLYINTGTKASPTWIKVGTQS